MIVPTVEHHPTQQVQVEVLDEAPEDRRSIKVSGPLTIHNFFEFQDQARKQPMPRVLIIDLSDVPYIDSAALGSLVGIHVSCERTSTQYALVGVNERLRGLFRMTGVEKFLVVRDLAAEK
jgi:anti-anti-sigma factor